MMKLGSGKFKEIDGKGKFRVKKSVLKALLLDKKL
jgi:hypothetical protein